MSVTKRATRNRVDPLPVRANHFFEKPESDVKRFDRGRVGVSYIALGVAIAGGMEPTRTAFRCPSFAIVTLPASAPQPLLPHSWWRSTG